MQNRMKRITKINNWAIVAISALSIFSACDDFLDTKGDIYLTPEMLETQYEQMFSLGYKAYTNVVNGFTTVSYTHLTLPTICSV